MRIGPIGLGGLFISLAVALVSCGLLEAFLNRPPLAVIMAYPTIGEAPLRVEFDGSGSYDPDGRITGFKWDFTSDGLLDATGVTTTHLFNKPGDYLTTLVVIDNLGATATASVRIQAIAIEPKGP